MAITQPTYPTTTSNLVTHVGSYADAVASGALGLSIHNGSAYPSRPAGYGTVLWIGPSAPTIGSSPNAINGDLWADTTP